MKNVLIASLLLAGSVAVFAQGGQSAPSATTPPAESRAASAPVAKHKAVKAKKAKKAKAAASAASM